jgi:hypothetical protein
VKKTLSAYSRLSLEPRAAAMIVHTASVTVLVGSIFSRSSAWLRVSIFSELYVANSGEVTANIDEKDGN